MPPAYAHTCVFTPLQADNSSNCTNHSCISSKILFSTLSQHELFIVSSPQFLHSIRIRLLAAFHRGSAAPAGSRALLQMPPTGTGCTQPHPVWLTTHPHCRLFSPAFTQTTPVARRRVYIFPVKHQEKKKTEKKQCLGFLLNKRVRSTLEIQATLMGNLAAMKTEHCKSSFAVRQFFLSLKTSSVSHTLFQRKEILLLPHHAAEIYLKV